MLRYISRIVNAIQIVYSGNKILLFNKNRQIFILIKKESFLTKLSLHLHCYMQIFIWTSRKS